MKIGREKKCIVPFILQSHSTVMVISCSANFVQLAEVRDL